ncbi:MAG: transposase [Pirellulaceae bacterium]
MTDCFSGNTSVVLHSEGRLEFVACWAHPRRQVVEASTYYDEANQLLGMIQALYGIETRAAAFGYQERQQLLSREATVVLASMRKWLDSPAAVCSKPAETVSPRRSLSLLGAYTLQHFAIARFLGVKGHHNSVLN